MLTFLFYPEETQPRLCEFLLRFRSYDSINIFDFDFML